MVGLEILMKIDPEKRVEFLQAFEMVKEVDQMHEKRIDQELFEEVKGPNTFLWIEHWNCDESLSKYCLDNKFRAMMGAIDVLGQLIHKRTFVIKEERNA